MGGSEGLLEVKTEGIYLGLGRCEEEVVTCLKHIEFPRLEGQLQLRNSGVNWHVSALCQRDTSLRPHFSLCKLHSGQGVRCLVPEAV